MKKLFLLLLAMALALIVVAGCSQNRTAPGGTAGNGTLQAAFVFNGVANDGGWYQGHDQARQKAEQDLSWVKTQKIENVKPGNDAERVFTELCDSGCNVIVGCTLDYQEDILRVAAKYPKVNFLVCSGTKTAANVESYYPRRDQLWYLLGQEAAGVSKTGKLGVVGSLPNQPAINLCINAWALGARSVNPDATVRVVWLDSFGDPARERDITLNLIGVGCDVITSGTASSAFVQACEGKQGVYAMSQWNDMSQFGPTCYLAGETFDWAKYYEETFTKIKDGTWKASMYFPSYSSGIVQETKNYQNVPDQVTKRFETTKAALLKDPDSIWQGPIYDNKGNLVVKEGERLTDDYINLKMPFLVKGVLESESK